MEGIVVEVAKQSPTLAVVVVFLWYLSRRDERSHEVQDNTRKAIDRNTEVVGGVIQVISKCNGSLPKQ